jgi:hypothetical protein
VYNGTTWNAWSWSGGDGTSCAVHPTNDNIMLAGRDAKQLFRTTDGGASGGAVTQYWGYIGDSRTAFVSPVAFSLSTPSRAYLASDNIHISTNSGASFTNNMLGSGDPASTPNNFIEQRHKTAIALAVSPTNANKLYVSTSPFAQHDNDRNNIYVTGQPNLLKTTTPATTPYTSIKGTLPDRFVMDIAISKYNDDSLYVALGGFGSSHVYLSPDGGATWLDRGAGLPNVPFNAILIDPVDPKVIYAGCDFGVWVSGDRGANWTPYNTGFWDATLIMDLQVDANNKLIAATHGKGVYRSDLYVHSTLPVTLNEFTGKVMPQHNELKWIVEDEQNLSGYELERSSTGSSYIKIATINSRNQTSQSTYSYNDLTPPFEGYYRLKMIDLDGTFTYSSVVFLRRESGKTTFNVLGNPFRDLITIRYQLPQAQRLSIKLYNSAGALMRKEDYSATAGIGMYTLYGFEKLVPGMYLLKIEAGKEQQTIKLLKN